MKNRIISVLTLIFVIVLMSVAATAAGNVVLEDNFNYNYLSEIWRTETASNCYVTIGEGNGLTGNSLILFDDNDNTSSPHYEGYAKAFRNFTPQSGTMTVEFYFNSNKIPVGHEVITLNMGNTVALEMTLNNHGQNSHIKINAGNKYHLLNTISANTWHKLKVVVNIKGNTAMFYLDDMNELKLTCGLTNKVEYIDRIAFSTGKELGEKSTFRIDDLIIRGTVKKAESISVSESVLNMNVGGEAILNATVLPYEATNKEITYASLNPGVAVVNEKGIVTAISEGSANITLKTADGATGVCAVNVGALKALTVDFAYNQDSKTIEVSGVSPYGAKQTSIIIKDNADKLIYLGEADISNNGEFQLTIPYTNTADFALNLEVKSGDLTATRMVNRSALKPMSKVTLDKEVYVVSLGETAKIGRSLETSAPKMPNLSYSTSNRTPAIAGDYASPVRVLTRINGVDDAHVLGNAEGDGILTVSTVEDVSAKATALVQVNNTDAVITDESDENGRKISVSLTSESMKNNNKRGEPVRFAAGYIAYTPYLNSFSDATFTVVKYNNPENMLAKYEVLADEILMNSKGKIELPIDYISDKVKDKNTIAVYGSDDGTNWVNTKAYYDSSLIRMVYNGRLYRHIKIEENKAPFTDIENHFAKNEIIAFHSAGILDSNPQFRPNDYITLDELSALLNKCFATGEYTEKSNSPVTREKAAEVICKLMGYNAVNYDLTVSGIQSFKDYWEIGSSFRPYMGMLYNSNVLKGDTEGELNPKSNLTRAEAVVIAERLK